MGQNGRMLVRLQVGHKSDLLVPALPNGHTHRWTVFVKSYEGDDFKDRSFVEKVRFDLHPDFPNPKRYVKEPPFKVTETGYASFSIPVWIWLAGKQYRVNYDLNLSMELTSTFLTTATISVSDYKPEFYSIAKRFGAEKVKNMQERAQLGIPGLDLPPSSSISPPPGKNRKRDRTDDGSGRSTPVPEKIRKKDRSADVSARSSPVPTERLKIRVGEKESRKAGSSSISPPLIVKEKKKEEKEGRVPSPGESKKEKKKENKLLDFVLDKQRPSPSPSPAPTEKLKKEVKLKDGRGSPTPSMSSAVEKLKKEKREKDGRSSPTPSTSSVVEKLKKEKREKDGRASPTPSTSSVVEKLKKEKREKEHRSLSPSVREEKEKKKEKEKNGLGPSPPTKEKRKEKEVDRISFPGISPPEKQKEKKGKEIDRMQGTSLPEKQKERKEKGVDRSLLGIASPARQKERKEKGVDRLLGISSPAKKKERKENEVDRLPGFTPPEKQKEKKEKREKDVDRLLSSAKEEKKKEREKEKEREREKEKDFPSLFSDDSTSSKREKEKDKAKDLPSLFSDDSSSPTKEKKKEKKRDKHKERDRAKDFLQSSSSIKEKERERDKEKRKELPSTISPPPVLLRQECAPSASASSSHGRSASPPTLVPIGNGRASSSYGYGASTVTSHHQTGAPLPSLLSTVIPPPHSLINSCPSLTQPSPSGSIGGRETPSEKASRCSISPALRNEETASSGGSSASSHSSERREQKRIPKLAPSQKDREAFSAPLPSVDAATVRRKIDLLTNPDKVFEVAFLLLDLDDTSHISTTKTGLPSLSYDLSNVDQKSLLRLESVLNRS